MCTTPTQQADDSVWHIPPCAVWSVMVFIHIANRTVHPRWERKKKAEWLCFTVSTQGTASESLSTHKGNKTVEHDLNSWCVSEECDIWKMFNTQRPPFSFGHTVHYGIHKEIHIPASDCGTPTCYVCSIFIATLYLVVMPATLCNTCTRYSIQIIKFSLRWLAWV